MYDCMLFGLGTLVPLVRPCSMYVGMFFGLSMLVRFCCLGPLLFVIYSSKLFNIVNKHLPNVNAYADDNQFKPVDYTDETAVVSSIQSSIRDVLNWMLMDKLKLNLDKTEFRILGTRQQLEKVKNLG